ncbi:hypothetical protein FKP32DRAFT_1604436 [Trametes sanguinea]|nr:hypothetical protein FKP32DRAFT_1604436 [Trametes sanguinea]
MPLRIMPNVSNSWSLYGWIQRILSVLAKDDMESVSYTEFVERVKDSLLLDCIKPSPLVDFYVRKALKRERLAARVKLVPGSNEIVMTASGFRYYQGFGVLRLMDRSDRRFNRLTIAQLRKETKSLDAVISDIAGVLRGNDHWPVDSSAEDIPTIVSSIVARIRALGEENTELSSILADNRAVERFLQRRGPATGEGRQNRQPYLTVTPPP